MTVELPLALEGLTGVRDCSGDILETPLCFCYKEKVA